MNSFLTKANENLIALFPTKHRPIVLEEIENVYSRNVLSVSSDAKTIKGLTQGYLTGILYLAPSALSSVNVCPSASLGCKQACLFTAGRGAFYSTTRARVVKTLAYLIDKNRFIATVKHSIDQLKTKALNSGLTPVVRLNGTSDILWEGVSDIIQTYSDIQFYDYTKIYSRMFDTLPINYHLTFSASENNDTQLNAVLKSGFNVAIVFKNALPTRFKGISVINGDLNDLRFLDRRNVVVGLLAKGRAKKDSTGFVKAVA